MLADEYPSLSHTSKHSVVPDTVLRASPFDLEIETLTPGKYQFTPFQNRTPAQRINEPISRSTHSNEIRLYALVHFEKEP